jgi:hypothetical protein
MPKMTHKLLKLQQTKQDKSSVNIPKKVIKLLDWKKGDKLHLKLEPQLWKEGINPSRIILVNQRLDPYKESPINFITERIDDWFNYVKGMKNIPKKEKEGAIALKQGFDQDYLEDKENERELNKEGLGISKSEIDGQLKTYPKLKIPKEMQIAGLEKRRRMLKIDLKEISKCIKNLKRIKY